ncbi:hypothetical protein SAMN05444682_115137 [Parapedobacter indicus]|uniref:Uncharacterized protein n=2 Tax=Parapedobacter indicus TaxID=1477437 RepID=A0A1I3V3M1_9SPHI|nr:hypothetical protein CLV26_11540 [Parapedobacter indicus]SFJ88721.1 hypothetical protein SAMN05444682_115137 [Parapedobacter indicus]
MFDKPYLLVIELREGFNTHNTYSSLQQAISERDKSSEDGHDPICIYNLNSKRYEWNEEEGPLYYETIAETVISSYYR